MALQPTELTRGLYKIADEVLNHCIHGAQSQGLGSALACGQFYGENVRERAQRGLHGTAAAISILLSDKRTNHVDVAKKLLIYVKNRQSIKEEQSSHVDSLPQEDELNTIKQAEILAALNDLADEPQYTSDLTHKLKSKQDASSGTWGFFLDDKAASDIATCYAVLALHDRIPPDDLSKSREYLWRTQIELVKQSASSDINAIAQRSLILYTLAVSAKNSRDNSIPLREIAAVVKALWDHCRPYYRSPFEVTVEYYRHGKNHYVRLPWQIYLAHALLRTSSSHFYSIRFQQFLSILYQNALSGGYAYVQAGPNLSTRTNSILYSFLNYASVLEPHRSSAFKIYDWFGEAWAKSWFRLIVVFLFGFGGLLLSNLWKTRLEEQSPIWVEVIGALYISALAGLYGSGRR